MAKKRGRKKTITLDTYDFKIFKKALSQQLTDNVKVNVLLSPIYFAIVLYVFHFEMNIPLYKDFWHSSVFYSLLSTLVYIYASHYYQPDLDVHTNRPGMGHFPLGKTIGKLRIGRFFKWVFFPINRGWYHLWTPYARLFTHRGITHFPIISTMLRAAYLLVYVVVLKKILTLLGINWGALNLFEMWLKNFFICKYFFLFIFLNFPIYLSDVAHIAVDYYDSVRKGTSFCPPKLPKGIIYQIYETIKGGNGL